MGHVTILLTNSTEVVGVAIRINSIVSFAAECLEDGGNLIFLPINMLIFGRPIPVDDPDHLNLMNDQYYLFLVD